MHGDGQYLYDDEDNPWRTSGTPQWSKDVSAYDPDHPKIYIQAANFAGGNWAIHWPYHGAYYQTTPDASPVGGYYPNPDDAWHLFNNPTVSQ
jgi:hypothetical protein